MVPIGRARAGLRAALAGCACVLLGGVACTTAHATQGQGNSLFQRLLGPGGEVPFPIGRLLERIRVELDPGADFEGLPLVLIPLGRSLQRHAAGDADYFRFPRVVVAVTGSPRDVQAPLLRDRLYLGYHEKAAVLEVISYNEAAGRFEFEIVDDYRAGATPRLRVGNRTLCTACHQNQAPIFSRQNWDESSASPRIAALLALTGKDYYGLAWRRGIDVANAIDDATDRANLLSVAQRVWQEGCGAGEDGVHCRAQLLWLTLRSRLSGVAVADSEAQQAALAPLLAAWRGPWRAGLEIPNPDLPNRLPFAVIGNPALPPISAAELRLAADVSADFDALELRPALERWNAGEPGRLARMVQALGLFVSEAELRALERALSARAGTGSRAVFLDCEQQSRPSHVAYACRAADGSALSARRRGDRVQIDRLVLAAGEVRYGLEFAERDGELRPLGAAPRAASGEALTAISFEAGRVRLRFADDLAPLRAAIDELAAASLSGRSKALAQAPLQRVAVLGPLMAGLGLAGPRAATELPPPAVDTASNRPAADAELAPFYRHCGTCHDVPDAFPPGFLRGERGAVRARVDACAPRMLYRLTMWEQAAGARQKAPMPPPASPHAINLRASSDFATMRAWLGERVREAGFDPVKLTRTAYVELPECAHY